MSDHQENTLPPVQIPLEAISSDALVGIIDNFIQREGTDYGIQEASYAAKVSQIERQLKKGDVVVAFDPNTETVSLVTQQQWQKFKANQSLS